MKRLVLLSVGIMAWTGCWCQIKLPQVRALESQGWTIQHSVMSWDSLSVYFSAQAPGATNFDLFRLEAKGQRWGAPERIDALSSNEDELWPSIGSDEQMLFYVRRTPAQPSEKNSYEKKRIWRAWYRDGQWKETAPIIISGDEDAEPRILEDNRTLLFKRRAESKRHDGPWQNFYSHMLDDHNWSLPAIYTDEPAPASLLALRGTIVIKRGGRPLTSGRVYVYDAVDARLIQEARVHPVSGTWRVALQKNRSYRIALTAEGYSYYYINLRTDSITAREERDAGIVTLDNQLALIINTYDAETQQALSHTKQTLPLGVLHAIPLRHKGYNDTVLTVNTKRPTVFTETELDITMLPQKSQYLFLVTHAQTGKLVDDVLLRLNGKPTATDTTLRVRQEMALQVSAPGFLLYDTIFNTGDSPIARTLRIALQPLEKGMVLQLRNIQFEYDSYELTENSNEALESLAQLLSLNPTLRIELSAHTDDQGSDRYNDKLSTLRGQAVEKWLEQRGIDTQRIETHGYGKRKPLVANDSEENRAINRRVEIKVIDF